MSREIPFEESLPVEIPEGETLRIRFNRFQYPQAGTGILTINMRKAEATSLVAVIRLLQGNRVLAANTVTLTQSNAGYPLTLSMAEIESMIPPGSCEIEDVIVEISPVGSVPTECCPIYGIPRTLFGTITSPECPALDGLIAQMDYIGNILGEDNWLGPIQGSSCDNMQMRYKAFIRDEMCLTTLFVERNGGLCFSGTTPNPVPCPFVSSHFSSQTWGPWCGCCVEGLDVVVVDVTP